MNSPHYQFIKSLINTRKRLIRMKKSFKNEMQCLQIIKKLQIHVDAYGDKWNEENWKKFYKMNYDRIQFLIPANSAQENFTKQLNQLIQ